MPKYLFYTEDGRCEPDDNGTDLADIAAAKTEAARYLGKTLRDHPEKLWDTGDYRVIVKNAQALTLFSVEVTAIAAPAALHAGPRGGKS